MFILPFGPIVDRYCEKRGESLKIPVATARPAAVVVVVVVVVVVSTEHSS